MKTMALALCAEALRRMVLAIVSSCNLHNSSSIEESEIECARRHFKAISYNGYIYDVAKDYKSLYDIVTK